MQLFSISRYTGEDESNLPKQEDEELNKLLKNVANRKGKRKHEDEDDSEIEKYADGAKETDIQAPDYSIKKSENVASTQLSTRVQPPVVDNKDELLDVAKFQTLGTDIFEKKAQCNALMPPWLRFPTVVLTDIVGPTDTKVFKDLPISKNLVSNLAFRNITKLFPIQKEVIPWLLNAHLKPSPFRPRDICVSAPTGSGKTIAFAAPIVEILTSRVECKIRALVVLPVTELALQVFKVFKSLVKGTTLKVGLLSTVVPFEAEQKSTIGKHENKYHTKVDIVVTTPGRLVEHLHNTKGFDLKELRFLVIDEADRIMEQSHHNWLYHLDEHLKVASHSFMSSRSAALCLNELEHRALKQPHKLLFSATLTQDPEKLQSLNLFQPKLFTSIVKSEEGSIGESPKTESSAKSILERANNFVGKFTTPAELEEYHVFTELRLKPLSLYALILEKKWERFLCFTNSAQAANRLAFVLQNLFGKPGKIAELSSIQKPGRRQEILNKFSNGTIRGLICSDALARGIDIPNVDVVISYDVPRHIKTYIHRVGRTARAGRQGIAVTILTEPDIRDFTGILSVANKDMLPEMKLNTILEEENAQKYSTVIEALQKSVEQSELMKTVQKKKEKIRARLNKKDELSIMDRMQEQVAEKFEINHDSGLVVQTRKERRIKSIRKQRNELRKQKK